MVSSVRWVAPFALLLTSCSGAPSEPAKPSESTASSASSSAEASVAPAGGCILEATESAVSVGTPVSPFEPLGTLAFRVTPSGCTIEVRDAKGAAKGKHACDPKDRKSVLGAMRSATCELGGDVFFMASEPKDESSVDVSVGRYTHPDEGGDLAILCAPFEKLVNPRTKKPIDNNSLDPSQLARIRAQVAEDSMTSAKWRLWLAALGKGGDRAGSLKTLRDAAGAAHLKCHAEWLDEKSE